MKDALMSGINWFLVGNLFFVLLSFLWLAIAVAGRSLGVSLGLDWWYALWEPLFQPAIGILMAAALFNGIASWLLRRFNAST